MKYFHFSFSELEYKHYLYTWCQQGSSQESAFKIFFIVKNSLRKVSVWQSSFIVPVRRTCSCCASSFPHFSLQLSSKQAMEIWIPWISCILPLWSRKISSRRKRKSEREAWRPEMLGCFNMCIKCRRKISYFKTIQKYFL